MPSDSQLQFKRPESILLVIHTLTHQVLLMKRIRAPAYWQSVAGSIRWSGETALEAAVRELREETGISINASKIKDWQRRFRFTIPPSMRQRFEPGVTRNLEHVYSLCLPRPAPVVLKPDEHSAYCWVDIKMADSMVWSWTNREAIRMVREMRV
ncbi:MAG: dihydroneopterin triphosphate diphosphatase [Gammaproteobacteria bacterium]|nr:dihydroneopterin triphosphate diphosphatase [Gammaproteobacteria bacterium]MYI90127.1 dihydroneopterin triphosphate diphosphatase [Gammaproteobacteria bacterium]